jgi:hypothetical protein
MIFGGRKIPMLGLRKLGFFLELFEKYWEPSIGFDRATSEGGLQAAISAKGAGTFNGKSPDPFPWF